ncbi:MAG TPA: serine/threonine-protein kinase [Ktedonobacteraceae bacterium]|nr:serine/threonine-protein kinase [Ktedonobacteraceae bacterium]
MNTNFQRLGKYELHELLGRGGMAEVWKAFDPHLKRFVAIKLLRADLQADPSFVARFEREAQVIAALHHPNIVQIYDFSVSQPPESESSTLYMVMKYVEGQTLAGFIRSTSRAGKFPSPATIVNLFTPIALAIDYAHGKGMIHRDIKPSNILLDEHNISHNAMGEPVLSDFGIAKLLGVSTGSLSGWWFGTPHYTAPEQVMGAPGNERSDIYSLGVILYEMCTGVLPFQGSTPTEIMMQHINTAPTAPMLINPAIPPGLTGAILRALAKDPAARFPTASAMVAALAEAFNMPIPKSLNVLNNSSEMQDSPTHLSPLSPRLPSGSISSSGALPGASPPKPLSSPSMPLPQVAAAVKNGQGFSEVFTGNTPHLPLSMSSGQLPVIGSLQPSVNTIRPDSSSPPLTPKPVAPPSPPEAGKRRRWPFIGLIIALILVVLGSGLGAFFLGKQSQSSTSQLIVQPIVGYAYFVSSGQTGESSNQGITDELLIELSHVSDPSPSKSYYGWLEPDSNQAIRAPILLGKLPVQNGKIEYLYPGDAQHTNLLSTMYRFLITEEDVANPPHIPSPDTTTWRYGAQLFPLAFPFSPTFRPTSTPQSRFFGGSSTALTDLRYLLSQAPQPQFSQPGGLDIWLFRNAEKILEWSVSARDDWQTQNFPFLHRNIVRILDYLDGLSFVQQDAPGEPVYVTAANAKVGLLDVDPSTHGYLYMTDVYLNALIQSPSSTPDQRKLAIQIDNAVKNVELRLNNVRKDAQQLVSMSPVQLADTTTRDNLLDTMSNDALAAFSGRIDPATGNVQEGVIQLHDNIQHLATFEIHPASSSCPTSYIFYSRCRVGP